MLFYRNLTERGLDRCKFNIILSQLDGEGTRQMQVQEQAIQETFKYHLSKQASIATSVNISDLRQSSNAETQTNIITSMLRSSGSGDNNVHARPTVELVWEIMM